VAQIEFDSVSKVYDDGTQAVYDLDLAIDDGELMVVVGPSGCGKTTALRMLAGLEEISDGEIRIGERIVNDLTPKDRDIAMVFQNYALYPHMTVEQNLAFGLKLRKLPKAEVKERVRQAAQTLEIEEYLKRKPRALSGGQRQRVAMGRAIVREPQAFLMDEPLSNLDAKLRVQVRAEIHQLQRRVGVTTLYVTHDQVEAMTMGDRVAVMRAGRLQQVDSPQVLYDNPVNQFVAGFIGSPSMNLLEFDVTPDGKIAYGNFGIELGPAQQAALTSPKVVVGSRPEGFRVLDHDEPGTHATIDVVEDLGNDVYVYLSTEEPAPRSITLRRPAGSQHHVGERITLRPARSAMHVFDQATGRRLPDYDGDHNGDVTLNGDR
jgi:multiple sugar transport system ATP-binding protein